MFSAIRRVNSQVMKYHLMLEPLEFRFAKENAKEKDKTLPGPCVLVWEKSPRISKSKQMDSADGKVTWPPPPATTPLQLIITMYKKDNKFLAKKTSLKAKIITGKGEEKTVGKCEIDVAEYCVDKEISHPPLDLKMGDGCVIRVRLHSRPVPTGTADDDISMMSGISTMEEVSTAEDWAAGFGKNKDGKAKGALDSDDSDDDSSDSDDDDDFGGFAAKDGEKKATLEREPSFDAFDDDFPTVQIPNVNDDPTILTQEQIAQQQQQKQVDPDVEKVNKAIEEANTTAPLVIEVATQISKEELEKQNQKDAEVVASLQATADHTQCNELINKYTHQIDLLSKDCDHYKVQLQTIKAQHDTDVEKFQAIVQLSQTSLNKMQDVVNEGKAREQTYSLQITTLQKKIKDNEKQATTENKKLQKEQQILTQDITILQSKLNTLRETLKHKEEHEQQLLIQMKTSGNSESILLSEKTQLQQRLKDVENEKGLLQTQYNELSKEKDAKVVVLSDFEKKYEKLKVQFDEHEVTLAQLKTTIQQEKETNLTLQQQLAQYQHDLQVKKDENEKLQQMNQEKDSNIVELKASLTTTNNKYTETTAQVGRLQKENEALQQKVQVMTQNNEQLTKDNTELKSEQQRLEKQYSTLQADLSSQVATRGEDMNSLQQQIKLLQATITTLEQFKTTSQTNEKQYQEQIAALQGDKLKLTNTTQQQEKELKSTKTEMQALEKEKQQVAVELSTMTQNHAAITAKYDEVAPKLASLQQKSLEQQTIITGLEKEKTRLEKDTQQQQQVNAQQRDRIVELEHDNAEYQNDTIPELKRQIKQRDEQLEQQLLYKDRYETEIAALSAALEALKNSKVQLLTSSPSSEQVDKSALSDEENGNTMTIPEGSEIIQTLELQRVRDEIAFLTTTLDKRTNKIDKLNAELERLVEENEELVQLRGQMEEDFQELEHERDELDNKLNILSTKYELLTQENTKLKTQQSEVNKDEYNQLEKDYKSLDQQYTTLKETCEGFKKNNAKLKEELILAEQLVAELNNKLSITETKLANSEINCKSILDKSTELAQTLNTELTRAHLENRALRDRNNTFDTLSATISAVVANSPSSRKDKLESRIVEELISKIDYYQNQLAESDETLLQTKQTWKQTSDVLTHRILDLEQEIAKLKSDLLEYKQTMGQSHEEAAKAKTTMSQQQIKQEKLAEVMSKFEIQLIEKKVQIADLTRERDDLGDKLKKCEQELQIQRNTVDSLRIECQQLHDTLSIVNSANSAGQQQAAASTQKKGKKKSRDNKKDDYDLDNADF